MALPGFELLYSSVCRDLKSSDDAVITVVHWNLISNGLKCLGEGETQTEEELKNGNLQGSEALPTRWNIDDSSYSLRYVDPSSNRTFLMKAVPVNGSLIVHLMRYFDEKAVTSNVKPRDYVNEDMSNVQSAFTDLTGLNKQLTEDLYDKLVEGKQTPASSKIKSSTQSSPSNPSSSIDPPRHPGVSPLLVDPTRPSRPFYNDPLSVGRADLDPLAGGFGGGMFMDPRSFPRPGFGGPMGPRQPGFPPGSIPPGARFDPLGPPGVRPGPDPDHERPPPDSYDDMFM